MVRTGVTRAVAVVAVIVVLAGCAVPVAVAPNARPADDGSGETAVVGEPLGPPSADTVVETGGFDPDYDAAAVLRRVERLRGLNATGRITIHEYADRGGRVTVADEFAAIRPPGAKALQLYSNESGERTLPLGYTVFREDGAHIYLMDAANVTEHGVEQEVVLAHEFTHALQFQHEIITPSRDHFRDHFGEWTTDAQLVSTALLEGDAMVVTEQYHEETRDEPFDMEAYNESLHRAVWPQSLGGTPYYYGYRYFATIDADPATRTDRILDPPASSAGLLTPGDDAKFAADGGRAPAIDADWRPGDGLTRTHADRVGELAIRHTLRINGLPFERAAAAADGWADDRMYYVGTDDGRTAVYWSTAWESADEATEFREAWAAALDANGAESENGTTVVPPSDAAPGGHYVVTRDGSTVDIVWAPTAALAERVDAERGG